MCLDIVDVVVRVCDKADMGDFFVSFGIAE